MRGKKTDWSGVVQKNLTVLRDIGKDKHGSRLWECVCGCGNRAYKTSGELSQGVGSCSRTCGVTSSNQKRARHGMWKTKVYKTWAGIKNRCHNPNHPHWKRYGGRGITVCGEWMESFESFYLHVGEPPTDDHTIDRIDNNKGYEPGNVRWATMKEQAGNRESNTWVEYQGKRMTWRQWADYLGIRYNTLMTRVRDKSDLSEILVKGYKRVGRPPKSKQRLQKRRVR